MQNAIAQRLAPFVPTTLLSDAPPVGEMRISEGASLFADLSGFTPLTEMLARLGDRGAEILSQTLTQIFTPLIEVIHTHGGTISHFYGDAMLVYFLGDSDTTVPRAFHCAAALQATLQSLDNKQVEGNTVQLSLTCGVGFGALHSLVVAAAGQREFVLAGSSVDEATAAQKIGNNPIEVGARAKPFLRRRRVDRSKPVQIPDVLPAWLSDFVPDAIVERLASAGNSTLAEHRPITSLFVQFNGLSAEDDAYDTQLSDYFRWAVALVNRYAKENGRVNRILTGDKGNQLHIILGAPTAPHAPAQSLRLALALQREKPAYIANQRIGVATGRAFAVPLGSQRRHEYTVIGKVVNLSARLCELCQPDEIFCDPHTALLTESSLQFEQQERRVLKGIDDPIYPMRLTGIKENPAQLEARYGESFGKPLNIHRDAFATLSDALQTGARHITLSGEAGSGKSRLVAAAAEQWLAQGGAGFVGACAPESAESPYTPWLAIVRALIDLPQTASPESQMERFHALLNTLPTTDQTELLIDDSPLLFEAMGLPVQLPEALHQLDAQTKQARLFRFIRLSLAFFTRIQPHLFVFEDIHHADRASLDLITFLRNADDLRLTFLVTTRAEPSENTTPVRLQSLAPAEAVAYVRDLLALDNQPLPESLISYFTRTGNYTTSTTPLFLDEVVRAMWANVVLRRVDGLLAVDEARLAQLSLPNNVHAFLLARIDQLPHIYRSILNIAAVIGSEFSGALLQQVAPFAESSMERAMQLLQSAEFIRPIGNNTYLFQNSMTRDAAYDTLPFAERRKVHADVAATLERQYAGRLREISAELARHHAHADHHQQAVQYGKMAAEEAVELYANREALNLFNLALRHLQQASSQDHLVADLSLQRARILYLLGDLSGAIEAVEAVLTQDNHADLETRRLGLTMQSEFSFQRGDHAQSRLYAEKLLTFLQENAIDQPEAHAIAHMRLGKALGALGEHDSALPYLTKAEEICIAIGDERRLSSVLESMAYCYYVQFDLANALGAMQRALKSSRPYLKDNELAANLNNLAIIHRMRGDFQAALDVLDEAAPIAATTSKRLYASILTKRGASLACMGNYAAAQENFDHASQLLVSMNDKHRLLELNLLMAEELHCATSNFASAESCLQRAGAIIKEETGAFTNEKIRLALTLGRIHFHRGDLATASSYLAHANTLIAEHEATRWSSAVNFYLGIIANLQQDAAQAKSLFERGLQAIEAVPDNQDYSGLLRLELGLLGAGGLQTQLLSDASEAIYTSAKALFQHYFAARLVDFVGQNDGSALLEFVRGESAETPHWSNIPI